MKISTATQAVLRNFSSINSNLLIKAGSVLSTINAQKNVLANAEVSETFPIDFGIYDTTEFLGVLNLFEDPEIEFTEKFATIREKTSSVKFYAADVSVLTTPTKKINFPSTEVEFVLPSTILNSIQKTASVLRAGDVSIISKDGVLSISVGDLKTPTSNCFNIDIAPTGGDIAKITNFTANFKIENLKLMSADYRVSLSSKKISRFVSADNKVTVFVALESNSTF